MAPVSPPLTPQVPESRCLLLPTSAPSQRLTLAAPQTTRRPPSAPAGRLHASVLSVLQY